MVGLSLDEVDIVNEQVPVLVIAKSPPLPDEVVTVVIVVLTIVKETSPSPVEYMKPPSTYALEVSILGLVNEIVLD